MKIKITFLAIALFLSTFAMAQSHMAEKNAVMVGAADMYPTKNIVENAVNSKDHTTLVAAVKAAGLVETLASEGPFTVFAPVNNAFEDLPEGTVETLLQPENKESLQKVLAYHVLSGSYTANDIAKALMKSKDGSITLTTVSGDELTAMLNGPKNVVLKDENGNIANIVTYDVMQSNGVIHTIDAVVLPK